MEMRRVGSLEVSVVGLGCNNFGRHLPLGEVKAVVHAAIDAGVTLFDTADVYYGVEGASEVLLGEAVRDLRDSVVIATKFGKPHPQGDSGWGGGSRAWVRRAVEASLRRLGTDRIDLYQLHEPDPEVPISETLGALGELTVEGKIREIGHSNFSSAQMVDAHRVATVAGTEPFASTQVEWNLLERESEATVIKSAEELGLLVLPFFPLSSGLLTGKYFTKSPDPSWRLSKIPNRSRFINEERLHTARLLDDLARQHGHSLLELAFSWLASQRVVASVIAGATRPAQIELNAGAAAWQLDDDILAAVDALTLRDRGEE